MKYNVLAFRFTDNAGNISYVGADVKASYTPEEYIKNLEKRTGSTLAEYQVKWEFLGGVKEDSSIKEAKEFSFTKIFADARLEDIKLDCSDDANFGSYYRDLK